MISQIFALSHFSLKTEGSDQFFLAVFEAVIPPILYLERVLHDFPSVRYMCGLTDIGHLY